MVIVQSWSGKSISYPVSAILVVSKMGIYILVVSSWIIMIMYILYAQAFWVRRSVLGKNICLLAQ